jgi:hypothetical protein
MRRTHEGRTWCKPVCVLGALLAASACGSPEDENELSPAMMGPTGPDAVDGEPVGNSNGASGATNTGSAGAMNAAAGSEQTAGVALTGASGSSGSGGSGAGVMAPPVPPPALVDGVPVCAHYPARSDGLLLHFDSYDPLDGSWGDPAQAQLTGGTSAYSCADDGACPESAVLARVRTGAGGLRIQAAVPSQGYTGMVLWFGPCVDASAFAGIELSVGGELSGAVLVFKLQTHINYPIDLVNLKGGCEYSSQATQWEECVPPEVRIEAVTGDVAPVRLAWADFGNGLPNPNVAPDGLVGVELQFVCPTEVDCALDLRLGALQLTPNP